MNEVEQREKVNIIIDENGKNIVLINDVRFKTRRTINWDEVEAYLKEIYHMMFPEMIYKRVVKF